MGSRMAVGSSSEVALVKPRRVALLTVTVLSYTSCRKSTIRYAPAIHDSNLKIIAHARNGLNERTSPLRCWRLRGRKKAFTQQFVRLVCERVPWVCVKDITGAAQDRGSLRMPLPCQHRCAQLQEDASGVRVPHTLPSLTNAEGSVQQFVSSTYTFFVAR